MTVQWYRVKKTYAKPQGGFLAIGPRYPGVLSDDGLVVLFTHWATHSGPRCSRRAAQEFPEAPKPRQRGKSLGETRRAGARATPRSAGDPTQR